MLDAHVADRALGLVLVGPVPVRLRQQTYRQPDVFYLRPGRMSDTRKYPEGADLVVEVVGDRPEERRRDLDDKPRDYAAAGVPEYWIVDPQEQRITVLVLDGTAYRTHGVFGPGEQAMSVLLSGFAVDVSATFAAGQPAA
jgi:Uma2 family endonuclease